MDTLEKRNTKFTTILIPFQSVHITMTGYYTQEVSGIKLFN